jgi:leucyl/phenylalanyl-tRNA--protein transferase
VTQVDTAFRDVIRACGSAELRPGGTWLSPEMRAAYLRLHRLGDAHSVETWLNGKLVGGLYGVALGRVFFGESMFSLERDASKVALHRLCTELQARGIELIDCQMATPHLMSLGAELVPRAQFIQLLTCRMDEPSTPSRWLIATPGFDSSRAKRPPRAPRAPF